MNISIQTVMWSVREKHGYKQWLLKFMGEIHALRSGRLCA